jgi:hypothetical protein
MKTNNMYMKQKYRNIAEIFYISFKLLQDSIIRRFKQILFKRKRAEISSIFMK